MDGATIDSCNLTEILRAMNTGPIEAITKYKMIKSEDLVNLATAKIKMVNKGNTTRVK